MNEKNADGPSTRQLFALGSQLIAVSFLLSSLLNISYSLGILLDPAQG